MVSYFIREDFEYAEDLLEHLRPSHISWLGKPQIWGFRGQADAAWEMVPSAFRPSFKDHLPLERRVKGEEGWREQNWNELYAFEDFALLADQIAVYIPGIEFIKRPEFKDRRRYVQTSAWPFTELVEGLAIAQHHGIPTRFIDFTYNPLVALFFAAYERYIKSEDAFQSENISVWAVNLLYLQHVEIEHSSQIEIVEVPTSRNPFLNAQRGFFLYPTTVALENWPPRPINEIILAQANNKNTWDYVKERLSAEDHRFVGPPIIRKFNIKASEVPRILKILFEQERISRVHLMPTLDNVVHTHNFMRKLNQDFVQRDDYPLAKGINYYAKYDRS